MPKYISLVLSRPGERELQGCPGLIPAPSGRTPKHRNGPKRLLGSERSAVLLGPALSHALEMEVLAETHPAAPLCREHPQASQTPCTKHTRRDPGRSSTNLRGFEVNHSSTPDQAISRAVSEQTGPHQTKLQPALAY